MNEHGTTKLCAVPVPISSIPFCAKTILFFSPLFVYSTFKLIDDSVVFSI
jgi:hypothetical protein